MTQYERMIKGLLYDPMDDDIMAKQVPYQDKLWEFNQLKPSDTEKKQQYMRTVFAECGENCYIELPFHANWGGHHVHFGSGIYANFNLTLVDDGHIYVGDKVMFGPNVTIATANHPIDAELRSHGLQYNKDVHIGENAWIGAGVIIVPGVHIGKNTVIGAGSIVTKDIPDNVVAVGNPCRVLRNVSEHDRKFFYKSEPIDWSGSYFEREYINGGQETRKVCNITDDVTKIRYKIIYRRSAKRYEIWTQFHDDSGKLHRNRITFSEAIAAESDRDKTIAFVNNYLVANHINIYANNESMPKINDAWHQSEANTGEKE